MAVRRTYEFFTGPTGMEMVVVKEVATGDTVFIGKAEPHHKRFAAFADMEQANEHGIVIQAVEAPAPVTVADYGVDSMTKEQLIAFASEKGLEIDTKAKKAVVLAQVKELF